MDWYAILWTTWLVISTPVVSILKLLYWPISALVNVILTLLSPVFYTVQLCLWPVTYVYSALPRLQPLYLFFGSAVFLGILAGATLLLTSNILATVSGIQRDAADDDDDDDHRDGDFVKYEESTGTATPVKRLDDMYSSQDSDWQWLDKAPDSRRRRSPGLLGQTILEEDDDS